MVKRYHIKNCGNGSSIKINSIFVFYLAYIKNKMKIAVIDLGTNTFNLLVAENVDRDSFRILHSSKIAVKLAKGSIDKKELKTDAFTRGINAIEKFIQIIN